MYFLHDVEKFEQNSISRRSMLKSLYSTLFWYFFTGEKIVEKLHNLTFLVKISVSNMLFFQMDMEK